MSEVKLKPCPLCREEASAWNEDGGIAVQCSVALCLLGDADLREDIWQALPRPSTDVTAVVKKLRRFAGDAAWEFGDGEPADIRAWCDELEGRDE